MNRAGCDRLRCPVVTEPPIDGPVEPAHPDAGEVLDLFASISDAASDVLARNDDWGWSGRRDTQYTVDLAMDDACLPPLLAAGFAVLSEESGVTLPAEVGSVDETRGLVVVDPLDGSTNAALGLPWCATALCLVVDGDRIVATVTNLRTRDRFAAVKGGGATHNGRPTTVSSPVSLGDAIVCFNGVPDEHLGWRQARVLGATALDICSIAAGGLDGYVDLDHGNISVWDYLASALILEEAGGVIADLSGRDLVAVGDDVRRDPVAASSPELLDELRCAVER